MPCSADAAAALMIHPETVLVHRERLAGQQSSLCQCSFVSQMQVACGLGDAIVFYAAFAAQQRRSMLSRTFVCVRSSRSVHGHPALRG